MNTLHFVFVHNIFPFLLSSQTTHINSHYLHIIFFLINTVTIIPYFELFILFIFENNIRYKNNVPHRCCPTSFFFVFSNFIRLVQQSVLFSVSGACPRRQAPLCSRRFDIYTLRKYHYWSGIGSAGRRSRRCRRPFCDKDKGAQ